ncbi:glycoside hydrolase family 19 protein [Flavobacterium sp.]|uniref:glycoside hydrolase family 19 protein n=3 Tax=Flavobacterium sp. TaxID=239 RepID=UPI0040488437
MKQGVKAIQGKIDIKAGVWESYTVSEWYPDTPMEVRNEANVKWRAYKINTNGSLTLALEKKEGVFRFGQAGIGSKYKIVAFLNSPELDNASSITITVVATEQPDITSIVLSDMKGAVLTKPLAGGQIVNAHVNTVGMNSKHKVVISLWEDVKDSHKLIEEKSVFVGSMGVAHAQFIIPVDFKKRMDALMGKAIEETSYHITAYALGELSSVAASQMIAKGEKPVLPSERKKQIQEHLEKKTKKQTTTPPYKGKIAPPAAKPKLSPLAESGGIKAVYFVDKTGKKITENRTSNLRVIIESQGLIDREINLKLFEDDTVTDDDFLFEKNYTLTSTKNYVDITLTKEMQEKGYEFGEGWEQELYVKIHVLNFYPRIKSEALKIDFTSKTIDVPDGVSTVRVASTDAEKKKEEKGCPNCDKDITLAQIKAICVDLKGNCLVKEDKMIKEALPYLNKYRKKVGINTCVRKAHFLAQLSQESKFYDLEEGFNYYWESLISTFSAFTTTEGRKKAKLWGRKIKDRNILGYETVSKENEENISNWAYKDKNLNKNFSSGDGSKYRGRGFKQITWKSNYKSLSEYFNSCMKINEESNVDWETNYKDLTYKPKDAIVSALAYWGKNNINSVANENNSKSVEKVTKKINSVLKGLIERKQFFKNAVEILKVNTCLKGSEIEIENGTVIIVSGTDTKKEKDPAQNIYWVMYKTDIYKDMSLETYKKLKKNKKLPNPDYTTYLSRDTHQTYSKKLGALKHSDKRFGQYNEIQPGEYFLVPNVSGQTYKVYVIDSESKSASSANGIEGVDGDRGGVAIHQYCPRFSVGCFTFNSGKNTTPVTNFINQLSDLEINDEKPVRFIVEERKVIETKWDNIKKGTKKWTGI